MCGRGYRLVGSGHWLAIHPANRLSGQNAKECKGDQNGDKIGRTVANDTTMFLDIYFQRGRETHAPSPEGRWEHSGFQRPLPGGPNANLPGFCSRIQHVAAHVQPGKPSDTFYSQGMRFKSRVKVRAWKKITRKEAKKKWRKLTHLTPHYSQ